MFFLDRYQSLPHLAILIAPANGLDAHIRQTLDTKNALASSNNYVECDRHAKYLATEQTLVQEFLARHK